MNEESRWGAAGWAVVTLATAAAGGALLFLLGLPGGVLIGAIVGVGALSLAGVPVARHPRAKQMTQIVVGTGIGASLQPESVELLRTLAAPILASIAALIIVGLLCGFALARTTGLDLATALTATAPGGMVEMVLVSDAIGGLSPVVAGLHVLRILAVLATLPLMLSLFG